MIRKFIVAFVAALAVLASLGTAPAAHAGDTSWGRHAAKDTSWGKVTAHAAKDTSWGRTAARKGWPGGIVEHAADDTGYNPPVWFRCDNGYVGSLGLGTSSRSYCGDVDAVYVGGGTTMKCRHTDGRWSVFGPGWNPLGNWTVVACYQQT